MEVQYEAPDQPPEETALLLVSLLDILGVRHPSGLDRFDRDGCVTGRNGLDVSSHLSTWPALLIVLQNSDGGRSIPMDGQVRSAEIHDAGFLGPATR